MHGYRNLKTSFPLQCTCSFCCRSFTRALNYVTVREEHNLWVSEIVVLREMFEQERDTVLQS